jgi:hypothetical protein
MAILHPDSRETLIEYALRALGHPVVQINVDYQQCEDRLDEALEYFSERHFDGVSKVYFKYQITQTDLDRGYIELADIESPDGSTESPKGTDILSVVKVFRFGTLSGLNMFDVRYQLALTDYFGINRGLNGSQSTPLAGYHVTMSYISLLEQFFTPEKSVRFNKVTGRIYIDALANSDLPAGYFLVIEAYAMLDPEIYTKIYNDRLLKKYVVALIKRQWGANMMKYDGVQLPGGITFKGAQIYQEASNELLAVEQEMLRSYELPVDFMMG